MISANHLTQDFSRNPDVRGTVPAGNNSGETENLRQHLRPF